MEGDNESKQSQCKMEGGSVIQKTTGGKSKAFLEDDSKCSASKKGVLKN